VLVAVRSNEIHGRMIVDVDWVPSPGGEAAVAMGAFVGLAPHCPGAQGVLYDTALRGVHHQRLMRDLGGTVALIDGVARATVDVPVARSDCCGEFVERCRQP
jgi:hypothetical protein